MEISLNNVSRKFNKEWIFRNISHTFIRQDSVAIVGPNGSGKTTLLQLIAGSLLPTKGDVTYKIHQKSIPSDQIYRQIALVAPALGLPEDFTLMEFLDFHFQFKNLKAGYTTRELPELFQLQNARDKYIKNFSTGMKQRVKLGVALYADAPLLLLDEPATNLDKKGFDWYTQEIEKVLGEKMVFVCSNRAEEYTFCNTILDIMDYK
ncbi:MAG: ATP-binding cassette domain-containing protein [Cyclobacteriaceae bacterium]|nr:ATP-binding cassette domain-containing protein [Cyclobacteriaceae bacterium]